MDVILLFAVIIGLMLIGVPIAVALGLSSIFFLLVFSDTSLAAIAQSFYQAEAGHYTLLAIPFFILASSFMSTGGVAKRIIRFSIACVGHLRGGSSSDRGRVAVNLACAHQRAGADETRRDAVVGVRELGRDVARV